MHGTDDDLVPCEQSWVTVEALREKGVQCGIARAEGARHLFDTFASEDPRGTGVEAVREGYAFLGKVFGLECTYLDDGYMVFGIDMWHDDSIADSHDVWICLSLLL